MSAVPAPGLADPVHDAQHAFRVALDAMSRPGTIHQLPGALPGLPLGSAMARLLLTLTDEDTPVWWQSPVASLRHWLRFHTGARAANVTGNASFAAVTEAAGLPELSSFRSGSAAAPEFGCTLLIEVSSLERGPQLQAHGPGIRERATLGVAGLPEGFWAEWMESHAGFPQGVDIFFTCGERLLGLPRTTRIGRVQGV